MTSLIRTARTRSARGTSVRASVKIFSAGAVCRQIAHSGSFLEYVGARSFAERGMPFVPRCARGGDERPGPLSPPGYDVIPPRALNLGGVLEPFVGSRWLGGVEEVVRFGVAGRAHDGLNVPTAGQDELAAVAQHLRRTIDRGPHADVVGQRGNDVAVKIKRGNVGDRRSLHRHRSGCDERIGFLKGGELLVVLPGHTGTVHAPARNVVA